MKELLTRKVCRKLYSSFKHLPPFNQYNLPQPHKVGFEMIKEGEAYGYFIDSPMRIQIDTKMVDSFNMLSETILHEMIHMTLYIQGNKNYADHGKDFWKIADKVCTIYNFDKNTF